MSLRASQRLRKTAEYNKVRAEGIRVACGPFIFQILINREVDELPLRRLGVIASRKVGNAVKRNRAKRWFREIFKLNQEILPPSCDLAIVVMSNFDSYSFQELEKRFIRACENVK